jgi:hypothetical protein
VPGISGPGSCHCAREQGRREGEGERIRREKRERGERIGREGGWCEKKERKN